ncbi:CBS domain-containing protein [Bacillus litorisediminis]|uniref:CBS domain-containing protein n=1 Tax=Bacillus litorisediminis TaxID=2922713 RepID=UPI001FAEDD1E|nr:CBS domain-containing protein [Bacillus litorisediminis]
MFVKSIMLPKHKCFTVSKDESLQVALKRLEEHGVDGLPVLDGNKYVGIITRYSIYSNFFTSNLDKKVFLSETTAEQVASHQEQYLEGNEIFEHTLLALKDFPLLAVVDHDKNFLGIVTRFDVLEQFQSAFGMKRKGVRIAFTSVETEGRIARLSEIARQFHESIISLVTFDETDKLVRRIVMKIEKKDNINKFIQKLEDSGFRVLDINEDE